MVRPQKVSVDIWKMVFGSCSYLALAFAAWVFLKLVTACFWLPEYLNKQRNKAVVEEDKDTKDFKEALLKYKERMDENGTKIEKSEDTTSLYADIVHTDDLQICETESKEKTPDKKNI